MLRYAAAATALGALLAGAAWATTHRDAVYEACVREGKGVEPCACAADRYASQLSPKELAVYARIIGREGDSAYAMSVMSEVGMSVSEFAALASKMKTVEATIEAECLDGGSL